MFNMLDMVATAPYDKMARTRRAIMRLDRGKLRATKKPPGKAALVVDVVWSRKAKRFES